MRRPAGLLGLLCAPLHGTLGPQGSTEGGQVAPPTTNSHHLGGPRSLAEAASEAGQVSFGVLAYWELGAGAVAAGPGAHPQPDCSHCPLWGPQEKVGIRRWVSVLLGLTPVPVSLGRGSLPIPACFSSKPTNQLMPPSESPPDLPLALSTSKPLQSFLCALPDSYH